MPAQIHRPNERSLPARHALNTSHLTTHVVPHRIVPLDPVRKSLARWQQQSAVQPSHAERWPAVINSARHPH